MVKNVFWILASHTNLNNKSVRVPDGEDTLYPEEDYDEE